MKKKEAVHYRPIHIPQLGIRLVHLKQKEVSWWVGNNDEVFRILGPKLDLPTSWKLSNAISKLIGRRVTPWVTSHLRIR